MNINAQCQWQDHTLHHDHRTINLPQSACGCNSEVNMIVILQIVNLSQGGGLHHTTSRIKFPIQWRFPSQGLASTWSDEIWLKIGFTRPQLIYWQNVLDDKSWNHQSSLTRWHHECTITQNLQLFKFPLIPATHPHCKAYLQPQEILKNLK